MHGERDSGRNRAPAGRRSAVGVHRDGESCVTTAHVTTVKDALRARRNDAASHYVVRQGAAACEWVARGIARPGNRSMRPPIVPNGGTARGAVLQAAFDTSAGPAL